MVDSMELWLPPDLDEWLHERADELGVEPETLLHQMIDTYRTSEDPDGELEGAETGLADRAVVESILADELDERLGRDLEAALDERLEPAVREALDDVLDGELDAHLDEATAALEERVDDLESQYRDDLADVRERVVQVKRETDEKTPLESHEETRERVESVQSDLEALDERVDTLAEELDGGAEEELAEVRDAVGDLEAGLDETDDRLETLAWVVSELRDQVESGGGGDELDRIRQKAAQLDVSRAKCDNCENGVDVSLLTEARCPHCERRVTGVAKSQGFFGKPRLLVTRDGGTAEGHRRGRGNSGRGPGA